MPSLADRRGRRVSARSTLTLLAFALALMISPQRASAHALLVRSDPANGTALAKAPSTVRLWFSEEISGTLSTAHLVDRDGRKIAGARAASEQASATELDVVLPSLGTGTYGVLWQVLAEDDGHTTSGVVVFTVGAATGSHAIAAGNSAVGASVVDVARRWIGICLLAGLVGALAVAGLVLRRRPQTDPDEFVAAAIPAARRRLLTFAAYCAALGVVVGGWDGVAEARRVTGAGGFFGAAGDLLSTRWGHLWLARQILLLALIPVIAALRGTDAAARVRTQVLAALAGSLLLVRVWVEAVGSHAASVETGRRLAVATDAIHILAACVWLGALPALALLLGPRALGGAPRGAVVRAVRGRFTVLVSASVATVLASGLYSAGREVRSVGDLTTTSYGRALIVKSVLFLVVCGVGVVNAARLRSGPARRLVLVETAIGALLLVAVGVLVESVPPRGSTSASAATGPTYSGSLADVVVTASVNPGRPGLNGVTVLAASSRRPAPGPIDSIEAQVSEGAASRIVTLRGVGTDQYFGTGRIDGSGLLRLTVIVHRSGQRLSVPLLWRADTAEAVPSGSAGRRLAPIVDAFAALVAIAATTALVGWLVGRRRGPRPRQAPRANDSPVTVGLQRESSP
jgi:copper transport protein